MNKQMFGLGIDSCYVCNEAFGSCRNQLITVLSFTEKPIYEILGELKSYLVCIH